MSDITSLIDFVTAIRWVNVVIASLVVALLVAETVTGWREMDLRDKRIIPWIIMTYVVIAYGSGELATAPNKVPPGFRVVLLSLTLIGLAIALLFGHYGTEHQKKRRRRR